MKVKELNKPLIIFTIVLGVTYWWVQYAYCKIDSNTETVLHIVDLEKD